MLSNKLFFSKVAAGDVPVFCNNAKPWKNQYDINFTQSASITSWAAATSLPGALQMSQAAITKDYVYLISGNNGSATVATVYMAPINSDGTLGTWSTTTSVPVAKRYAQVVVTDGYIYLIGGRNSSNTTTSTVHVAPVNGDGTLGTWTSANSLNTAMGISQAIITTDRIYLLGGHTGSSASAVVQTATITAGAIGTWSTTTSMPGPLYASQAITTKNRVYMLGGNGGSGIVDTTYTAPIVAGIIGTWTTGNTLDYAAAYAQVFSTHDTVYLLGASVLSHYVQIATIDEDGLIGTWAQDVPNDIYDDAAYSQVVATKDHLHLLGGNDGSATAVVQVATISGSFNDYTCV